MTIMKLGDKKTTVPGTSGFVFIPQSSANHLHFIPLSLHSLPNHYTSLAIDHHTHLELKPDQQHTINRRKHVFGQGRERPEQGLSLVSHQLDHAHRGEEVGEGTKHPYSPAGIHSLHGH